MTITKELIRQVALERNLFIPDVLFSWLLTEYETEPFDGFFLEEDLKHLVWMHHDAYVRGMLDPKPHDRTRLWKNRYEGACEILDWYRSECHEIADELEKTREDLEAALNLLDLHGIPH